MYSRAGGWLLIVVSAVSFGVMGVLVKLAEREGVDMFSALAARFVIAAVVLVPLAALRRAPLPGPRTLGSLFLFGSCGYVAHSLCFFTSLRYASAGLVALLLYLYPVLVALGAALFFHERLGPKKIVALGIALAGMTLVADLGPGNQLRGILLALSCAFIYGAYILACSRVARNVDPLMTAAVIITGAAVVYAAIALVRASPLPPTATGWTLVATIGVVSTAVAIATFFAAMERIGATAAAIGSTLEPIVTVVLGAGVLRESLSLPQILGGMLIIGAVGWLALQPRLSSP